MMRPTKTTDTPLRYLCLFPKRYKPPQGLPADQWRDILRRQGNTAKALASSSYHWRLVTFRDGRKELAYLTAYKGWVYRGLVFRRPLPYWAVHRITVAF